jgi:hypothetical protein
MQNNERHTLFPYISSIRGAHFIVRDGMYILRASRISETDMMTVIDVLEGDTSVTNLDLGNNNLTEEAVSYLAKVVANHPTLLKLDLTYNSLKEESAAEILDAVKANKRLLRVKVEWSQRVIDRQIIVNHWPSSHCTLPQQLLETCNMLKAWTMRGSINLCRDTCNHLVRCILNDWVESGPGCPDLLGENLDCEGDEWVSWFSSDSEEGEADFGTAVDALYCMHCLDYCAPHRSPECNCECSMLVHTPLEKFWLISNIDAEGDFDLQGSLPPEIWEFVTSLFVASFPVHHFWNPVTGESRSDLKNMVRRSYPK